MIQTVTILGAHALGGAEPENSGFDGEWQPGELVEIIHLSSHIY